MKIQRYKPLSNGSKPLGKCECLIVWTESIVVMIVTWEALSKANNYLLVEIHMFCQGKTTSMETSNLMLIVKSGVFSHKLGKQCCKIMGDEVNASGVTI